ncbi:ferric-chelate reductase 1-like [Ruditapes philippinarum]|uniref:ferric-chelate reductase 1-like n=1 Tax=Ruditapes philippinarum TaxID=129788 RepID=UPI00295C3975|nr:ferric-chelate reductase 1-like [Ruditapes philippinarum]
MYFLTALVLVPSIVLGYPTGPPPERCDNMIPEHGVAQQSTAPPYEITFSPDKLTYTDNELIQVTLKGKGNRKFRGFLIEPRPSADNYTTFGSLQSFPDITRNPCSNERANKNVALSQSNNSDKTSITFTWKAPSSNVGNIVFVFTVVETAAVYWVKGLSETLRYTSEQPTQTSTGAQTVPTTQPSQTSSQSPSSMISRDPECGKTKSCFPAPSECSTNCDYLVSWKESGTEDVEFTLQKRTTENNYWIAIGFSKDPIMGDDSVIECVSLNGQPNVQVSYNIKSDTYKSNQRLDSVIKKDSKCGESVGCYHDCKNDGSCGFLLTWKENGDNIDLTLTCKLGGNSVYCAIGLSSDNKMGDDSVFECIHSEDTTTVSVSYNDGRSNKRLDQDKFGLSSISAAYGDGILSCTFSRKKSWTSAAAGRKKRATASSGTYFDMNKDWTLFYAYGKASGGFIGKHAKTPTISTQKADFQSFMDISATTVDRSMIKLHGILMTVAWMFFAVMGIFMARFYKLVWPEGMEWCGQKRWFIVHRSCMVTAFLLTAASFVIIFVHVGGYAEIEGTGFEKSHPIIGIVVMCLALINPIMAVFRPHPGTPKRPIFNVFHKGVGTGAAVCSIVNIFSGTILTGAFVPDYVRIILWVAVGWCALIEIISYIYDCRKEEVNSGQSYELKPVGGATEKQQDSYKSVPQFKVIILGLHSLALIGLTAGVCVIIGMGDQF